MAEADAKIPPTEELKELKENAVSSTAAGTKPSRRPARVTLNIPVTMSGETEAGSFSEDSQTLKVNVHGALIRLTTKVAHSQLIHLTNRTTWEQQVCRVISVNSAPGGKVEAGVEFTQSSPNFWRVVFPPSDGIPPVAVKKPQPLHHPRPKRAHKQIKSNSIPEIKETRPIYAGFWLRFAAAAIDALILIGILQTSAFLLNLVAPGVLSSYGLHVLAIVLIVIFVNLYLILMESSPWQATFGKKMMGLCVTDLTSRRITLSCATGRTYAKYLSGLILGIVFIAAAFTERKQALHDKISKTLVLRQS